MKHDETIKLLAHPVREFVCPGCGYNIDVSGREMLAPVSCPKCGKELTVPARVGDFILVQILGSGGMATVYRAYDSSLNRYVAIKVMRRVYGEDPKFAERFLREARAAARLNHPNVVQIYSCSEEKGQPYIVMELVAGEELDQTIKREGHISEKRVLQIALDVAKGLSAAADIGLVHGDIKPANIIFDKKNIAKVADFGLARFTRQEEVSDGEIWGTPYYIAPEKARKQKEDHRSDIYCLGATLYHALTGVPPFDGETATDVVLARLTETPTDIRQHRPEISDQTTAVIMRMLELDRMRRYPNYLSLISDLEETLKKLTHGHVTHAFAASQEKSKGSTKQKGRPAILLVAGIVLFALLFWVGSVIVSHFRSEAPIEVPITAVPNPFAAERDRELSIILHNLTPENTLITRQLLSSVLSVHEPLHEGRFWIRLFRVTAHVLERDMEIARRDAGTILLRPPPSTTPAVRSEPAVWPGELMRLLLGEHEDTDIVLAQESDPRWYHDLEYFYRGLRLLLDGDFEGAARAFERYAESEKESGDDPDWPYAFRALSSELHRRARAWMRLSEDMEGLLAQKRVDEARSLLDSVQSQIFMPFKKPFLDKIDGIEASVVADRPIIDEQDLDKQNDIPPVGVPSVTDAVPEAHDGQLAISVNFNAINSRSQPLKQADVAGVVPRPNWNNIDVEGEYRDHRSVGGGLIDSLGNPVPDIKLHITAATETWNLTIDPASIMLSDFISSFMLHNEFPAILRVDGLAGNYDLILYPQAFGANMDADITVTTKDESGAIIATKTRRWEKRSTPRTVVGNTNWVENDSYQEWPDLTGTTLEVVVGFYRVGLSGFQLISRAVTTTDPVVDEIPMEEDERRDLARISAWQQEHLAQLTRTINFVDIQRTLRILRTSMESDFGRSAISVEEDRVRRMQDLLSFLVNSINDRPYADAQARLGGRIVRATQRGVTIMFADGAGYAERAWSTIALREMTSMARYYVTQYRLRPEQEAEIMLSLALYYHASGLVDVARGLMQRAITIHGEIEPVARQLIP